MFGMNLYQKIPYLEVIEKLPYHCHSNTFLEELFFISFLEVIGMEVLGT
tara:strand:+ start:582 stop:728 length:147 start_codon:yes stop_codon:yes gene_type:complete